MRKEMEPPCYKKPRLEAQPAEVIIIDDSESDVDMEPPPSQPLCCCIAATFVEAACEVNRTKPICCENEVPAETSTITEDRQALTVQAGDSALLPQADVFVPAVAATMMDKTFVLRPSAAVVARKERLAARGLVIRKGRESVTDRGSCFMAYVAHHPRLDLHDVQDVCEEIRSDSNVARAAHPAIYAALLGDGGEVMDDDGEEYAGRRLLATLKRLHVPHGTLVVVSRWWGGVLLGPARFRHIEHVAEKCLRYHQFAR